MTGVRTEISAAVVTVALDRPARHNTVVPATAAELTATWRRFRTYPSVPAAFAAPVNGLRPVRRLLERP